MTGLHIDVSGSDAPVIVAGVLVALGVDSWNTARLDEARGEMYLERLAEDLEVQIETLDERIPAVQGQIAGGDSLKAMVEGGTRPGGDGFEAIVRYHALAERFEVRVQESRDLLRNPVYGALGARPLMRETTDEALLIAFLESPEAAEYIERLQTYLFHRRVLWREWRDEATGALALLRAR